MKLNIFAKITKRALSLNKAVYFFIIFIVLFGSYTFKMMSKSLMPEFEIPYITVVTTMIGASADEMEELVTKEVEEGIVDVADLEEFTSHSSKNVSTVILKFRENTSTKEALQNVQRAVDKIKNKLPKDADDPMVSDIEIYNFPTILVNIPADKPYYQQKDIIDELKMRLARVDGIKRVDTSGLEEPKVTIYPSTRLMDYYSITNSMLVNLLKDSSMNIPLGEKEINGMVYSFETDNRIKSLEELRNTVLLSYGGRTIRLQDIADVVYEESDSKLTNYIVDSEGKTQVVNLEVYLKEDADSIKVNEACQTIVAEWNKEHPADQLSISLDTSVYIKTSIKDISTNAFSGILSVIIVLFLFINLKEAVIACLVIPITLITSIVLFPSFGMSINMISIVGLIIALGMLVDNAIVVIEMIDENRLKFAQLSFVEIVLFSINKVGSAIFSSTITTICAFIPLLFLSGPIGSMIKSIPMAMSISVSLSFLVSITLTPVLAYTFLRSDQKDDSATSLYVKLFYMVIMVVCGLYAFSSNFEFTPYSYLSAVVVLIFSGIKLFKAPTEPAYKRIFSNVIHAIIRSKLLQGLVLVLTWSLFFYSLSLLGSDKIPKENFPQYDEPMLQATVQLVEGTDEEGAEEVFLQVENILSSKEYVEFFTAILNGNKQIYFIELKDNHMLSGKEIFKELSNELHQIPNANAEIASDNIQVAPILIRLSGEDYDQLIGEANKVVDILEGISGVVSPKADYEYGNPTVKVLIDKEKARENNLLVSDVLTQVRYLVAGQEIGNIEVDGHTVSSYVKYRDVIHNTEDIRGINMLNGNNQLVPIYDFVTIEEYRNLKSLDHLDGKRILEVKAFNDENTSVQEIVKKFRAELERQGGIERGVSYSIAGEYDEMGKTYQDLAVKFIIALVLVYIVLLIQFNSFMQPLVIILCIPFSIIGVSLGYFFSRVTFSSLTFLGIISLVGIAINDAIVLMDFINQLRREGMNRSDSIIVAANSRLKPIITTSLTTIIGVMPLAIYNPSYSQMAYALMFGLISSTLLTLIVIPTVLNIVEEIGSLFRRKGVQVEK